MTKMNSAFLLAMVMLAAMATPALAKRSFDVCVNPLTDVATQDDATKRGAFPQQRIFSPPERFRWVG